MKILKQLTPIIVILLITWGLFVSYLDVTIRYDEAFTYLQYAHSPIFALFVYSAPNNHLFHSLLVWLSTTFIGDSLIAIRLPALAAGLLTITMVYRIGHQFFSRETGLLGAVFLLALPFFGEFFVNARGYTLSGLLSLVYLWIIFHTFHQSRLSKKMERTLFIVSVLLVLTLPTMVLLIAPMILLIWVTKNKRLSIAFSIPMIFGTLVGTMFYFPALVLGLASDFSDQFGFDNPTELWLGFASQIGDVWILLILGVGCLLSVLLVIFTKDKHIIISILLIFAVAIIMSWVQYWLTGGVLFPRNYIYLVPIIALFAAIGWVKLAHKYSIHSGFIYGICILGIVFATSQYQSIDDPTEVDALYQVIQNNANPSDQFIVGCCLDSPIYYQYRDNYLNDVERIVFIPTDSHDIDTLVENYQVDIEALVCQNEMWADYEVLICSQE